MNHKQIKSACIVPQTLLIIVGPTAVGKTDIALSLAEKINAEIISADSMQVYRGMDIGTAKPTHAERSRVPHHLIDVADPRVEFSVGDYLRLALAAIEDIRQRGKTPLVVGGTGLYVRALSDGIFEGPGADWALRDKLLEREQRDGPGTLYAALEKADPVAASRIHPSDLRRIVRALEVYEKGGLPISKRHEEHRAARAGRPVRIAGLTRGRAELYSRIEERVDSMMEAGFLDEVKALRDSGCKAGTVSMQAIGYKQLMAYLDGVGTLDEAVRLIKRDTKRFAKRQFTWFNADERVRWVDITGSHGPLDALPGIEKALEIFGIIR
jgi:tRNA dimethylallyltransferase